MHPPAVKFTLRRMMVAAMVFLLVLFATSLLSEALWVGSASVPLEFLCLDASTGRPIEGASVTLAEGHPEYRATTGADGKAHLVIRTTTAGRSSVIRSTRSVHYGRWSLVITANGYKSLNDSLRSHTLEPRYHSDAIPPPIVIHLPGEPTKP